MPSFVEWPVLVRQALLILVPIFVSRGMVPDYLADPLINLATYVIGTVVVGYVIYLGQRREQPARKIAETARLADVQRIALNDPDLATDIASPKVVVSHP